MASVPLIDDIRILSEKKASEPKNGLVRFLWESFLSVLYCVPIVLYVIIGSELWDTPTSLMWSRKRHKAAMYKVMRFTKEYPVDKLK